ncbi:MAG: hypothetical protein FWC26_14205 [Fibromonadales bacterium]|nr:hypothetical protein [Fibromonadales bacterium]
MNNSCKGEARKGDYARVYRPDGNNLKQKWFSMSKKEYNTQGVQPDFDSLPEEPFPLVSHRYTISSQALYEKGDYSELLKTYLKYIDRHLVEECSGEIVVLENAFWGRIFYINSEEDKKDFLNIISN